MTALYVAGLVTNGDRVALIESTKPGRAWELAGGAVEPGEEWRAALSREVHEEMGVDVPPHRWVLVDVLHGEPTPGADFESTIIVARAEAAGDLVPGSDAQDARWYARGALPEDISKLASRQVLFDWQAERPFAHVTREEIEEIQRRAILEQQTFHCVSTNLATANRLALEVLAQRGAHGILRDMVARAEQAAEKLAADLAAFKRATVDATGARSRRAPASITRSTSGAFPIRTPCHVPTAAMCTTGTSGTSTITTSDIPPSTR